MKKLVTLALAGMIGMAVIGAGYALWFDTLEIHGTVNTGTVDVALSLWDPPVLENDHGKEVGQCLPELIGEPGDPELLNITVLNAYPSYECYVTFDVHSLGTIPVHVHQPITAAGTPPWVKLVNCFDNFTTAGGAVGVVPAGQEVQLHQGDKTYCVIYIHFTNADGVLQNAGVDLTGDGDYDDPGEVPPYVFGFLIGAHQFNEEPGPFWP